MLKALPNEHWARCAACHRMDVKHKLRHAFSLWFCSQTCEDWFARRRRQA